MAVIHEDYLAEVRDIVELYCERLALRVDVMNVQRYVPVDCAELVGGIVYTAPFLDNSPELLKVPLHYHLYFSYMIADGVVPCSSGICSSSSTAASTLMWSSVAVSRT